MSLVQIISRPCLNCGREVEVSVTAEEMRRYFSGEHVQDVFPPEHFSILFQEVISSQRTGLFLCPNNDCYPHH
jgi:hypothetical protein